MHPYLINIDGIRIPSYGVFVSIGFFLAAYLAAKRAPQEGIPKDAIYDLAFWVLVAGLLGARLYFVLEHINLFAANPLSALYIWKGGLAIIGGIASGAIAAILYCRKRHLDLKRSLDIVAWVLPLAQAIGRIGCLCAGCCYGKPCHLPWAIVFSNPESLAPIGVPLHPTEIYHMLSNLLVFGALTLAYRKKRFDGQITSLYLMLYPIGRFIVEFYRGDDRKYIGPLSLPQWLCIVMFICGLILYLKLRKEND